MRTRESSAVWLRRLIQEIARAEPPPAVEDLLALIARASQTTGAILWEGSGGDAPSVVGRFFSYGFQVADTAGPDRITAEAFADRTLVMTSGAVPGVVAALPVDYLDGSPGVLTLLGDGELTGDAFDLTVELLEMLPALYDLLQERRSLALVKRCNDILREPEAAPDDHFGRVCAVVAEVLGGEDVTIFLREPDAPGDDFPPIAGTALPPGAGATPLALLTSTHHLPWVTGAVGQAIAEARPVLAAGDQGALMAAPVLAGEQVLGAISCGGRAYFTQADLSALALIAPYVAQYWGDWTHRRTISAENRSWMQLASGITAFDKLASEQLARPEPDDERIYEAASRIICAVIPDCLGAEVHRTGSGKPGRSRLGQAYPAASRRTVSKPFALSALRSGRQLTTTEQDRIARDGVEAGWLTCTPIQVGGQPYGVLSVFGGRAEAPPNALQAGEIIGDQLGLYLHLRQALSRLQEARGTLQATSRSQAEALEDLEHQLGGPLMIATERVDLVIQQGRIDGRTEAQLRAARGLCRKAMRVALSAGVFAALSKGLPPTPKLELLSVDDLLRLLIAGADDAQLLSNPRRHIRFEVQRDAIRELGRRLIRADRSFVEQCVGNLLDNAAKYSYEETAVEIGGLAADGTFAVTVKSTGLPMSPQDAAQALHRNWRGPAARIETGEGSGLGLWIADHLMQSMQGTIRVRPVQDSTTVLLTFPLV